MTSLEHGDRWKASKNQAASLTPALLPRGSSLPRRNQAVEALRVLGAFLIVWYHCGGWGSPWAYAGLSVFIILSLQFEFGDNYRRRRSTVDLSRALLVPWGIWFLVYEAFYVAVGGPILTSYDNPVSWLLAGSSFQIHLWYLPFIFFVLLASAMIKRVLLPDAIFIGAVVLSLIVLATISIWRPWSLAAGPPFIQYCQAMSPVLLGVVIGLRSRARFGTLGLAIVLGAMLVAGCVAPDALWLVWPHVIGAALVLVANSSEVLAKHLNVERVARYMLGVYLAHPLLIKLAPHWLFAAGPLAALVIFLAALVLVVLLEVARTRIAKTSTVSRQLS